MSVLWSDVSALDPVLAAVPTVTQAAILTFVTTYLSPVSWGDKYDLATLLLAAHFGALNLRGGGSGGVGPVQSESAGSVSRSYATTSVAGASGALGSTVWGQQYQTLARACLGGGVVI